MPSEGAKVVMPGADLFQEAASLLARGDLPTGAVSPGTTPVVTVAAAPRHPSNTVLVHMRRDGGPLTVLRTIPEGGPFRAAQQWYRAALPTLNQGDRVDYRIELMRAGQRLATLPADGSWLSVIGNAGPADTSTERMSEHPAGMPSSGGTPRWNYDLTFFAALTINLRPEILGETPEGYRINFFVDGGRVIGPRIDAIVRRDGGDWMCIRRDGIGVIDVRTTYETADGALILDRAGGIFDLGPQGHAKVMAGDFTGLPEFYATPTFMTAHPNWQWLNRIQGFGIGRVVMEELRVECDLYIPRVLERLSGGEGRCARGRHWRHDGCP
jgi:hypothetical protein